MMNILEPYTGRQSYNGEPGTAFRMRNTIGVPLRITVIGLVSGTTVTFEWGLGAEMTAVLGNEPIEIKLQDPDMQYVRPTLVQS